MAGEGEDKDSGDTFNKNNNKKQRTMDSRSIPVVGIGSSAGGLKAIEKFFSNMPTTRNGISFVLVQHLDPKHKSVLKDLINRYTELEVYEATQGSRIQPNTVYIIPPNRNITLKDGKLHLTEPKEKKGVWLPIDHFFRSLAEEKREQAICVVLSGTGADGTLGLKEVKGNGGMAMVQEPGSAGYDGMPRNAIGTDMVDYVLPPEKMPQQLISYVEHAFGEYAPSIATDELPDSMTEIFELLYSRTGHDFSYYKRNTVVRRIGRRMAVNSVGRLDRYVRYLQQNPNEVDDLFKELLITVTSFFRDPEAFRVLKEQAIIPLLKEMNVEESLRIWVPGCASGEEAYSIAMLVQETMEYLQKNVNVQIFGTDIDEDSIDKARTGIYPISIVADVSSERLNRFFLKEDDNYQVSRPIRDMVVFAVQNVVEDPPFSNMDLISCRNLLIYMGQEPQNKLIPLFHYSLKPGGYLFLGTSENVGGFTDLFDTVDRKMKLFKSLKTPKQLPGGFSWIEGHQPYRASEAGQHQEAVSAKSEMDINELAKKMILERHTPPTVITDKEGEVLYIHGNTGKYLQPPSGEPSWNVTSMAREGLKRELTTAIHRVVNQKQKVIYPRLQVKTNGEDAIVNLEVEPVIGTSEKQERIMVVFKEVTPSEGVKEEEESAATDKDQRIKELKDELSSKEEYLQTIIEELQTSNEELQSTNEELQSSNEELQSTNEELETSQEELRSLNEELETVNQEHQEKIEELRQTNSDMKNMLNAIKVGALFVDRDLTIKRFTSATKEALNLIQSDIGRPVKDISTNLKYDNLIQDMQEVLDTLISKEIEVQTNEGTWFLTRILPYHTINDVIEGVVVTFIDITEKKRTEEELRRMATVIRDSNDAITVHDFEGNITHWNRGAEIIYGYSEIEALKMNMKDLVPPENRTEELAYIDKIRKGEELESFETKRVTKDGNILDVWLTVTKLVDDDGQPVAVSTTERDITQRKGHEKKLSRLATALQNARDAITIQSLDGTITEWNVGAEILYGYSKEEMLGKNIFSLVPEENQREIEEFFSQLQSGELIDRKQTKRLTKNDKVIEVEMTVSPITDGDNLVAIATVERVIDEHRSNYSS